MSFFVDGFTPGSQFWRVILLPFTLLVSMRVHLSIAKSVWKAHCKRIRFISSSSVKFFSFIGFRVVVKIENQPNQNFLVSLHLDRNWIHRSGAPIANNRLKNLPKRNEVSWKNGFGWKWTHDLLATRKKITNYLTNGMSFFELLFLTIESSL